MGAASLSPAPALGAAAIVAARLAALAAACRVVALELLGEPASEAAHLVQWSGFDRVWKLVAGRVHSGNVLGLAFERCGWVPKPGRAYLHGPDVEQLSSLSALRWWLADTAEPLPNSAELDLVLRHRGQLRGIAAALMQRTCDVITLSVAAVLDAHTLARRIRPAAVSSGLLELADALEAARAPGQGELMGALKQACPAPLVREAVRRLVRLLVEEPLTEWLVEGRAVPLRLLASPEPVAAPRPPPMMGLRDEPVTKCTRCEKPFDGRRRACTDKGKPTCGHQAWNSRRRYCSLRCSRASNRRAP